MYNVASKKAEEFISDEEILDTLAYAEQNKHNEKLISEILNKARERKGLTHREAAVLLDCDSEEKNKEIYALAEQISPLVRRVLARNASPFSYTGTQTYIVGHGSVAIIDPGPLGGLVGVQQVIDRPVPRRNLRALRRGLVSGCA